MKERMKRARKLGLVGEKTGEWDVAMKARKGKKERDEMRAECEEKR